MWSQKQQCTVHFISYCIYNKAIIYKSWHCQFLIASDKNLAADRFITKVSSYDSDNTHLEQCTLIMTDYSLVPLIHVLSFCFVSSNCIFHSYVWTLHKLTWANCECLFYGIRESLQLFSRIRQWLDSHEWVKQKWKPFLVLLPFWKFWNVLRPLCISQWVLIILGFTRKLMCLSTAEV